MVVRGGIRQSRCYPALHMLQRSVSSSSNGLRHTWQCASSGREVGRLVVGRQEYQWLGYVGVGLIWINASVLLPLLCILSFFCKSVFLVQSHSNTRWPAGLWYIWKMSRKKRGTFFASTNFSKSWREKVDRFFLYYNTAQYFDNVCGESGGRM